MADPAVEALLRVGDSCLVLAQRLGAWCGHAPALEEDIALANIALDVLGHARGVLTRAGEIEGAGRDEDALAYLREAPEFRNLLLVEQPNGDFAHTMVRQLLFDAWAVELWKGKAGSTDTVLAGIAEKAAKEAAYHVRHSSGRVVRLGDGTEESHRRVQAGLDEVWPYAFELFERDELVARLVERGVAADPDLLRPQWEATVADALKEATLVVPDTTWRPTGGRAGKHLTSFGYLLAELQHLHRSHPGARW